MLADEDKREQQVEKLEKKRQDWESFFSKKVAKLKAEMAAEKELAARMSDNYRKECKRRNLAEDELSRLKALLERLKKSNRHGAALMREEMELAKLGGPAGAADEEAAQSGDDDLKALREGKWTTLCRRDGKGTTFRIVVISLFEEMNWCPQFEITTEELAPHNLKYGSKSGYVCGLGIWD